MTRRGRGREGKGGGGSERGREGGRGDRVRGGTGSFMSRLSIGHVGRTWRAPCAPRRAVGPGGSASTLLGRPAPARAVDSDEPEDPHPKHRAAEGGDQPDRSRVGEAGRRGSGPVGGSVLPPPPHSRPRYPLPAVAGSGGGRPPPFFSSRRKSRSAAATARAAPHRPADCAPRRNGAGCAADSAAAQKTRRQLSRRAKDAPPRGLRRGAARSRPRRPGIEVCGCVCWGVGGGSGRPAGS